MTTPGNTPRLRPESLPADARWEPDAAGGGWHQGGLDADGRRHGAYRSWTAAGVLRGASWYDHGKRHGEARLFHPDGSVASVSEWVAGTCMDVTHYRSERPTPEPFPAAGPGVWSVGCFTRDGKTDHAIRYFDRGGAEVGPDGAPLPPRPETVPAEARWLPDQERWVDGGIERGTGRQVGRWRWWSREGVLRREEERDARGEVVMVADHTARGALEQKTTVGTGGEERSIFAENGKLSRRFRRDTVGRQTYQGSWSADGTLAEEVTTIYDGNAVASVSERGAGGGLAFAARRDGDAMACVLYGPRGAIRATGQIRDGKLHGTWKLFDPLGALEVELDATPLGIAQDVTGAGLEDRLGEALARLAHRRG